MFSAEARPGPTIAGATPDALRQWATVAAAVAQVALPVLLPPRFDEQPPDVVQPSPGTFAVWLPAFAASLGYAGWQARPAARTEALPRRVGWPLAAAFASTGVWAPLVRARRLWPAQGALLGIAAGAGLARRRLAEVEATEGLTREQRWAVVPATGMLAAWGAAAAGVNLAAMLPAYGLVRPGVQTVAAGDVLVLALGALGVSAVRPGAPSTSLAHAGTLLWALGGIVTGQSRRSPSAALCATVSAAVLASAVARSGAPAG